MHWPLYLALRPGSQTVAEATVMLLVVASRCRLPEGGNCVRDASAIRVTNRKRFARVRRLTACPEAFAVVAQPESCGRPRALGAGGVRCCRSNERCGSPERNVIPQAESLHVPSGEGCPFASEWGLVLASEEPSALASEQPCVSSQAMTRANTKFTQPEVWPTPAGRTGLDRMTNRRDNRQHNYAGARVAAQVCCDPVVIGPRTSQSVRLADRRGKPGLPDP